MKDESSQRHFFVPINEISFTAWAGGQFNVFNPFGEGRGDALKAQLVRAAIAGMEAMWLVDPTIRFIHVEPAINVLPNVGDPGSAAIAQAHNEAQYHAWDMLAGRLHPELGGSMRYLDIIGVNYYCHNQWRVDNGPIDVLDPAAKHFSHMLKENHARYGRPLFVAETGIEAELRPSWFRHVCQEARSAISLGVPLQGVCLYPVLNHPGWDDDRHCPNGLIDYSRETFERQFDAPLLAELHFQQSLFSPA
jgi:polysaccharide biosynthesis protein PelF